MFFFPLSVYPGVYNPVSREVNTRGDRESRSQEQVEEKMMCKMRMVIQACHYLFIFFQFETDLYKNKTN